MKVLGRTFIDVHVQRMVCMVVVICLLRVDRQVRQLTSALADTERPKHAQGLPQKGSQQEERAQAVGHAYNFNDKREAQPEPCSGLHDIQLALGHLRPCRTFDLQWQCLVPAFPSL